MNTSLDVNPAPLGETARMLNFTGTAPAVAPSTGTVGSTGTAGIQMPAYLRY